MECLKYFVLIVTLWSTQMQGFQKNRYRIMTPNTGQSGSSPSSQGNINEIATFPQSVPDNKIAASVPLSTTLPAAVDTVTSVRETVIRVEFPSAINVFVNVTNSGQPVISTNFGTSETSTTQNAIDTSAVSTTVEVPTEASTIEAVTDETLNVGTTASNTETTLGMASTSEMTTPSSSSSSSVDVQTESTQEISSTVNVTNEMPSSMDPSTTDSTTSALPVDNTLVTSATDNIDEIPTTVEISTVSSTVAVPSEESIVETTTMGTVEREATTENTAELSTTEINVEIIIENSTVTPRPTVYESSTDALRQIQININLSDNNQNTNFGSTTPASTGNAGQLQNRVIYKEKCEEYYTKNRAVRKATVQVFIVGGTGSTPKEFPHMAALGYGDKPAKEWLCGGSLISENFVITAAHCVTSKTLGDVVLVRLGTTLLNTETLNSQDYQVVKRITHPDYTTEEQYNDIALLQLDRSVTFSEYISPICLYSSSLNGEVLIATGWGKTEAAGEVSPELQKVELEYFPNKECQDSYSVVSQEDLPQGIVPETQICAGSRTEEKDTCQGDSGGPLQIKKDERIYLVGITSFGIGCGKPGRPGVYTRVSYYIPWIEKIVWGNGKK